MSEQEQEQEQEQEHKALTVTLSELGEIRWLATQEVYRSLDHAVWTKRGDDRTEAHNKHIQTTNRFNMINSVVSFAAYVSIIIILVKVIQ